MDGNEAGRVRWRPQPAGKASNYLSPFNVRPGDQIILCCRVSERVQHRRGNCDDQAANLTAAVNAAGGHVLAVVKECGPGTDPGWLAPAAALAQRHGVRLLAETTDRLVRSSRYHSQRFPDAQAAEHDLWDLAFWLDGVEAMTLLPPDATPAEVRSYQRKRGQTLKGQKGGRPTTRQPGYKKAIRKTLKRAVFAMKRGGASIRGIAAATGVAKSTCQNWIHGR